MLPNGFPHTPTDRPTHRRHGVTRSAAATAAPLAASASGTKNASSDASRPLLRDRREAKVFTDPNSPCPMLRPRPRPGKIPHREGGRDEVQQGDVVIGTNMAPRGYPSAGTNHASSIRRKRHASSGAPTTQSRKPPDRVPRSRASHNRVTRPRDRSGECGGEGGTADTSDAGHPPAH